MVFVKFFIAAICISTVLSAEEITETHCFHDEVFDDCGSGCPKSCRNLNGEIQCEDHCVSGCFCKDDLIRAENGFCVTEDECENNACRPDEVFNECGSACPKSCKNLQVDDACVEHCALGCFCKEGFVRSDNGSCILPHQCDRTSCGADEIYKHCGAECPVTCENFNQPVVCPAVHGCIGGCFCKDGLIRGHDNSCVAPWQCEEEHCGENEEFLRCGSCVRTCDNYDADDECHEECKKGCFCKQGYVRNAEHKCVRPFDCPPKECKENEEFRACGSCVRTCDDYDKSVICMRGCKRGCFCKEHFVKDDDDNCIKPEMCPQNLCKDYEVYTKCGSACPKTCDNFDKNETCTDECVKGCFCKDDLYKQVETGECVERSVCERARCGDHEVFKECGPTCEANCDNYKDDLQCDTECVRSCFCEEGYVRGEDGTCVSIHECEAAKCGRLEEYRECGTSCEPTCDSLGEHKPCNKRCHSGCFCRKGYIRGDDGQCISIPNCMRILHGKCGRHEVFRKCGPSCEPTCDDFDIKKPCTLQCVTGCFCQNGFVRGDNGRCIPIPLCLKIRQRRCRAGEEYKSCGTCEPTCDNYDKNILCSQVCRKGCFCKGDLVRNNEGRCVPTSQCPQNLCGPDEYYTNCGSCPLTCDNYDIKFACTAECRQGCYCKGELVRDKFGKCVSRDQCPRKCTRPGEIDWKDVCVPKCTNRCEYRPGDFCTMDCQLGCFCAPGLLQDTRGRCVPPPLCDVFPDANCRPDELYWRCKPFCKNTCGYFPRKKCPNICIPGCFCRPGLVKNGLGECIPWNQCRKPCPINERYSECVNPCNNCEIKGNCQFLACFEGCDCIPGYYRNNIGNCIPEKMCPKNCDKTGLIS